MDDGLKIKILDPEKYSGFNNECFLIFDLDGTLLDTDRVHYESYSIALNENGRILTWNEFQRIINTSSIDIYLREIGFTDNRLKEIKQRKHEIMKENMHINPITGADTFIKKCINNGANIVIVTNSTKAAVEHFKSCLPFLNDIKNWICRDDYVNPKPNEECVQVAIDKFYKNEKYIIGFENTMNGYLSMKRLVPYVYIVTDNSMVNYDDMKKETVILIKDYRELNSDIINSNKIYTN